MGMDWLDVRVLYNIFVVHIAPTLLVGQFVGYRPPRPQATSACRFVHLFEVTPKTDYKKGSKSTKNHPKMTPKSPPDDPKIIPK